MFSFFNKRKIQGGNFAHKNVAFLTQTQAAGLLGMKEWNNRLCGLTCLWMAIESLISSANVDFVELFQRALGEEAFHEKNGWIHSKLVFLAQMYGLKSGRKNVGNDLESIGRLLKSENIVIASLSPDYANPENKQKNGHLLFIFGMMVDGDGKVAEIWAHDPGTDHTPPMESVRISRDNFLKAFSGNVMYFSIS